MSRRRRKSARSRRPTGTVVPGLVIEMLGLEAVVRPDTGPAVRARLRKGIARRPGVVVGDQVEVRLLETAEKGPAAVVERVAPRRNVLVRAGYYGRPQNIAANLERVVIVVSPIDPPLRLGLVDRYLAAARLAAIEPLICFNKRDLDPNGTAAALLAPYRALGLMTVTTSIPPAGEADVAELAAELTDRRSLLVGHSGVGKSSLAMALIPDLDIATEAVSEVTGRGRHTTTTSRLLELPRGGELVDTPGIRSFGLFGVEQESLHELYPEYQELADQCRFRGCTHSHEPGCAVKAGVEEGILDEGRHERYLRIRESLDEWLVD